MSGGGARLARTTLTVATVLALILSTACTERERTPSSDDADEHHVHPAAPAADAPSGHSIFHLASTWRNQRGEEVPLSVLEGRVQVLAMVYTHCEAACPRIIADMHRIRSQLSGMAAKPGSIGFVLVSIDPERDTPERLATFARESRLDDWVLLQGEDESVRELAAVLGVRYRRISETDFTHSNLISVIGPEGVVLHQQVGLGVDPDETIAVVEAAVGG